MSELTRETVAAAMDAERFNVGLRRDENGFHARAYSGADGDYVWAKDHATVVELSRQQREFIVMVRDYYLNQYPQATKQANALLALWPDDPTLKEARDHDR